MQFENATCLGPQQTVWIVAPHPDDRNTGGEEIVVEHAAETGNQRQLVVAAQIAGAVDPDLQEVYY